MNIDLLLEIAFAWIADPSFVGMTKSVGDDKGVWKTRGAGIDNNNHYSVLKLLTGFSCEALNVCDIIVTRPINNKNEKHKSAAGNP